MTGLRVATRALALVLLAVLAAPMLWKAVSGDFYMTVQGRSMTPTYRIGDVLVVQDAVGDELSRPGTVVVVALAADAGRDASMYVHRVVEPLDDGTAWLQGDGNAGRDPRPIAQQAVIGTPRTALTGPAGQAFAASQSALGRVVLGGTALALLIIPVRRTRASTESARPEPEARAPSTRSTT
ncbi:S24 family peptidase [Cellulomonas sp. GbtcB1]|uniref:S24 family peptidase n=1 Tax=Cellulomonas sp. GbtcB1 TaxID=2824746 RepID=UPI001C307683|nr:S24 family peptidase [Cellulomonas sp. GbtcB1]